MTLQQPSWLQIYTVMSKEGDYSHHPLRTWGGVVPRGELCQLSPKEVFQDMHCSMILVCFVFTLRTYILYLLTSTNDL